VVTVVEQPVPPMNRSAPKRTLSLLLSLILGGIFGTAGAFVRGFLRNAQEDEEEHQKLEELKRHTSTNQWRDLVGM
jgi:uncharacterized protein involved in exopolysaccharide biosynthesis